jgi:hypothetical protein
MFLYQADKNVNQPRIKLQPAVFFQFFNRFLMGKRSPVRPGAGHRLIGIGNGQDAGIEMDLISLQPFGVTASVPVFVMLQDEIGQRGNFF